MKHCSLLLAILTIYSIIEPNQAIHIEESDEDEIPQQFGGKGGSRPIPHSPVASGPGNGPNIRRNARREQPPSSIPISHSNRTPPGSMKAIMPKPMEPLKVLPSNVDSMEPPEWLKQHPDPIQPDSIKTIQRRPTQPESIRPKPTQSIPKQPLSRPGANTRQQSGWARKYPNRPQDPVQPTPMPMPMPILGNISNESGDEANATPHQGYNSGEVNVGYFNPPRPTAPLIPIPSTEPPSELVGELSPPIIPPQSSKPPPPERQQPGLRDQKSAMEPLDTSNQFKLKAGLSSSSPDDIERNQYIDLSKYNLIFAPATVPLSRPSPIPAREMPGLPSGSISSLLGWSSVVKPSGLVADGSLPYLVNSGSKVPGQLSSIISKYWVILRTEPSQGPVYINSVFGSPAVTRAIASYGAPADVDSDAGLFAFYRKDTLNNLMEIAWNYSEVSKRYVFDFSPDRALSYAQVIALGLLDAANNNQPLLPADFRDQLLVFITRKLSVKEFISWIQQAVNTGNTIAQYLLVHNMNYLIKNPYADRKRNTRLPPLPVSPEDWNVIVDGGPFTVAEISHLLYFLTMPFVHEEVYRTFVRESGLSSIPPYLAPAQIIVNNEPEHGIARIIKFMIINMEFFGETYATLLSRNLPARHAHFYDFMILLNNYRLNSHHLSTECTRRLLDKMEQVYIQQIMASGQGIPQGHQDAIEYFLGRLNCMSVKLETPHPLCYMFQKVVPGWYSNNLVKSSPDSRNYRMNWMASQQDPEALVKMGENNTYLMAYILGTVGRKLDEGLVAKYYPKTPGGKLIKAWENKLNAETESIRALRKKDPHERYGPAFPLEPCRLGPSGMIYITAAHLPIDDFSKLDDQEKLNTMAGILFLMTHIGRDDLDPSHFFNFDMKLPSQLNSAIISYCKSIGKLPRAYVV